MVIFVGFSAYFTTIIETDLGDGLHGFFVLLKLFTLSFEVLFGALTLAIFPRLYSRLK